MDSIDNIWDQPVHSISPRRSQRPLFLANSDDDAPNPPPAMAPQHEIDVDALFAEVEEEDDPFILKPLGPLLDTEALRREAEARHRKAMPLLTPHEILPSSSLPREGQQTTDKDENKEEKKVKRRPIKLDENRLLSDSGFPQLIKDSKNFRVKGKGHEAADLDRLLNMYQFWSHQMYPKTQFRDTIERVEKLCHSRRMNVSLSVWRDEAHGVHRTKNSDEDDIVDLTKDDNQISIENRANSSAPESGTIDYPSSSPAASRPPTSASELDDDMDIDAIIEEQAQIATNKTSEPVPAKTHKQRVEAEKRTMDDDENAFWGNMDENIGLEPPSIPSAFSSIPDEDEEMWNIIDEMEHDTSTNPAQIPATTSAPSSEAEDNWEDMYA